MYLSLNWLKDFVKIPKGMTPDELALKLTLHTVEVDGVKKQSETFKNIVVGKIKEISKHPNADRLQIVKVYVGEGELLSVVCGASNIEVGQLVPVAKVGAVLPGGLEIKEADVRGEKSFGMLCAEDELGLSDDHDGIMILKNKIKPGINFADYLRLNDIIIEVDNKSITNRPDLWSHYGMARELSVFLNTKLTHTALEMTKAKVITAQGNEDVVVKVKVEDPSLCPRYMAVVLDGVKIEDSPQLIQERLIAVGMRPINNIVDVTNYVMLELGQPLHAFDAAKILLAGENRPKEIQINVRKAKAGEIIETLDGQARKLDENMLLIADMDKPIAVAGVMGGSSSEIDNNTTSIMVESANFNFISIRKTAQKLGLRSEASMRYEKSLDPNLCEAALSRVVEILKTIYPNVRIASVVADEKNFTLDCGPIILSFKWLEKRIGVKLDRKWVISTLNKLGFSVEKKDDELSVTVPTWRATHDVERKEDIVEEIARIYGYDNIEKIMPDIKMLATPKNHFIEFKHKVRSILAYGCNMIEIYNYSFVGDEQLKKLRIDNSSYLKLANPIASHQTMLRQSLMPNMIMNAVRNQARLDKLYFFEIGNVFLSNQSKLPMDNTGNSFLPYQEERLGMLIASNEGHVALFNELKTLVEYLFSNIDLDVKFDIAEMAQPGADEKMYARIISNNKEIGKIFLLDNKIARSFGAKKDIAVAEINIAEIAELAGSLTKKLIEFEKYPPAIRDLAFVVDKKILYNDIKDEISNFSELIKKAELFDVYEGDKIGTKNKSLAFHVVYQADKTLTHEEIDALQTGLLKRLEEKFDAQVRNF